MLKFYFQKTVYKTFNLDNDEDEFKLIVKDEHNKVLCESSTLLTLEEVTNLAITLTKFDNISTSINFTPEKNED